MLVLAAVELGPEHAPTGSTRHVEVHADGTQEEIRPPSRLRIVSYEGDSGVLLLYEDESGAWLSDTFHETVEDAMAQAEWEFTIHPEAWTRPGGPGRPLPPRTG